MTKSKPVSPDPVDAIGAWLDDALMHAAETAGTQDMRDGLMSARAHAQVLQTLAKRMDGAADPSQAAAGAIRALRAMLDVLADTDAGALFGSPDALKRLQALADTAADRESPRMDVGAHPAQTLLHEVRAVFGGAFEAYQDGQLAEAHSRIAATARASAEQSARAVKPDLNFGEALKKLRAQQQDGTGRPTEV